ncbi:MAG: hypothetical protein ACR2RF_14295 [Geminicoccaceae bacterium]
MSGRIFIESGKHVSVNGPKGSDQVIGVIDQTEFLDRFAQMPLFEEYNSAGGDIKAEDHVVMAS